MGIKIKVFRHADFKNDIIFCVQTIWIELLRHYAQKSYSNEFMRNSFDKNHKLLSSCYNFYSLLNIQKLISTHYMCLCRSTPQGRVHRTLPIRGEEFSIDFIFSICHITRRMYEYEQISCKNFWRDTADASTTNRFRIYDTINYQYMCLFLGSATQRRFTRFEPSAVGTVKSTASRQRHSTPTSSLSCF